MSSNPPAAIGVSGGDRVQEQSMYPLRCLMNFLTTNNHVGRVSSGGGGWCWVVVMVVGSVAAGGVGRFVYLEMRGKKCERDT